MIALQTVKCRMNLWFTLVVHGIVLRSFPFQIVNLARISTPDRRLHCSYVCYGIGDSRFQSLDGNGDTIQWFAAMITTQTLLSFINSELYHSSLKSKTKNYSKSSLYARTYVVCHALNRKNSITPKFHTNCAPPFTIMWLFHIFQLSKLHPSESRNSEGGPK